MTRGVVVVAGGAGAERVVVVVGRSVRVDTTLSGRWYSSSGRRPRENDIAVSTEGRGRRKGPDCDLSSVSGKRCQPRANVLILQKGARHAWVESIDFLVY